MNEGMMLNDLAKVVATIKAHMNALNTFVNIDHSSLDILTDRRPGFRQSVQMRRLTTPR
jgi:hypothetical protein